MNKPESYPFLAIAKRFGYDYGDVLAVAALLRPGNGSVERTMTKEQWDRWKQRDVAWCAIEKATEEQQAIRDGLIDWQTGEPIRQPRCVNAHDRCYGGAGGPCPYCE